MADNKQTGLMAAAREIDEQYYEWYLDDTMNRMPANRTFTIESIIEKYRPPEEKVARKLLGALVSLGVMPDGYCFCHQNRDPIKTEKKHTGECRLARAAIAAYEKGKSDG